MRCRSERESVRWSAATSSRRGRIPRAPPPSVKVTSAYVRILTRLHTHLRFITYNNESRFKCHMMRFLAGHAFKDILIVPAMGGHIDHACSPMRGTIAQCTLSSAWDLTIICPTFLARSCSADLTITSVHFQADWLSWHNASRKRVCIHVTFTRGTNDFNKCFIH